MSTDQIRISDREREAAVAALGDHYAAGRLTKEEFDERSNRAYQARTSADLSPLFRDLPSAPRAASAAPVAGAPRTTFRPQPGWHLPRPLLVLVLVVVVGLIASGALARLWILWVVLLALWWSGALRRRHHRHYHHWR